MSDGGYRERELCSSRVLSFIRVTLLIWFYLT